MRFPKLPLQTVEDVVESFIGTRSLSSVGRGLGLQHVMRWTPAVCVLRH
jgi:dsRNA-specific ribonuclease